MAFAGIRLTQRKPMALFPNMALKLNLKFDYLLYVLLFLYALIPTK
jgi:hypothetical protein